MAEQSQMIELCDVYNDLDAIGKEQLVNMADKFLGIQKILDKERLLSSEKPVISEQQEVENGT